MQAFVKIGDTVLQISERLKTPSDTTHVCLLSDTWDLETFHTLALDEVDAIKVLQGFLNIDGPIGRFAELFPK